MLRLRPDRFRQPARLLRGLRSGRKMGTRGVGVSAHRRTGIRLGSHRQVRGGTDGCSGGIWRFYSVGQPCRNLG